MSVTTHDQKVAVERALRDPSPLTLAMGLFAVALGVAIVVGHREAWSGPEYNTALQVPGAPESWGWVLAALGLFIIIGKWAFSHSRKLLLVGLVGCGLWYTFFALAFLDAHLSIPGAGPGQAITYLFIALLYFYRFAIYRRPPLGLS